MDLVIGEAQFQHTGYLLEVVEGDSLLSFSVYQHECLSSTFFSLRVSLSEFVNTMAVVSKVKKSSKPIHSPFNSSAMSTNFLKIN